MIIKHFYFEDKELYTLSRKIRNEVFVNEQGVTEDQEYDEFEADSEYYLLFENNIPLATARWRKTPIGIKLERFAVLNYVRGKNYGASILKEVLNDVILKSGKIYLHSQLAAAGFYKKFGFEEIGEHFNEAGIEHVMMVYKY